MERLNFSWLIPAEVAGHRAPESDEDIQYLKGKGIQALVRMAEKHIAKVTSSQVESLGLLDYYEPVVDFTAPSQSQIDNIISFITQSVADGKPVGISCHAGIGRTGTILACYLVSKCSAAEQAISKVKQQRLGSIETKEQKEAVIVYAKRLGKS
jgi:atypical dual specificity phosphatase